MMKTECSIVKDLLPLYVEDMVSEETAQYVSVHLNICADCKAEYDALKSDGPLTNIEKKPDVNIEQAKSFKTIMRRMNRQFNSMAYSLVILLIFLGFSWTGGENLMYNSLIMPVVGIFGYYVFKWKAVYKIPVLLFAVELFIFAFKLWDLDFHSAIIWTLLYAIFVFVGIAIAFLLHYVFGKEKKL